MLQIVRSHYHTDTIPVFAFFVLHNHNKQPLTLCSRVRWYELLAHKSIFRGFQVIEDNRCELPNAFFFINTILRFRKDIHFFTQKAVLHYKQLQESKISTSANQEFLRFGS